jgi:cell division protein FtsQ
MWHKPQLMTVIADLLLAAAAATVLVAVVIAVMRLPLFPLRQVQLAEAPAQVRRAEIERVLSSSLRGNFFSANLETFRQSLEGLPWVRRAEVRRRWPDRVEVRLEEHRAVARWGDGGTQLVNVFGEIFAASGAPGEAAMPVFHGPTGAAPDILRRHQEFSRTLASTGRRPQQVHLSPRLAWQLRLDDGMVIELGREQTRAPLGDRLRRFVDAYPAVIAGRQPHPLAADLRYPNGFAIRATVAAAVPGSETKGKS